MLQKKKCQEILQKDFQQEPLTCTSGKIAQHATGLAIECLMFALAHSIAEQTVLKRHC